MVKLEERLTLCALLLQQLRIGEAFAAQGVGGVVLSVHAWQSLSVGTT